MLVRFLLCCSYLLLLLPLRSQTVLIDSLYQKLEQTTSPVHQADILLGIARLTSFANDAAQSEVKIQEAIALSRQYDYSRGEILGLLTLSAVKGNEGDIKESFKLVEQARDKSSNSQEKSTEVAVLYMLAENYFYYRNDYRTALRLLETALKKVTPLVPYKDIGNVHKNLGLCYDFIGKNSLALQHYDLALEYFSHPFIDPLLGESSALEFDRGQFNTGQIHIYAAQLHEMEGRYDLAIEHIEQALKIYLNLDAKWDIAWAYEHLGLQMRDQGKIREAIEYFRKSKALFENVGDANDIGNINRHIGICYEKVADFQEALSYHQHALDYFQTTTDTLSMLDAHTYLGNVYLHLSQWASAEKHFQEAEVQCQQLGDSSMLDIVFQGLASVASQQQKWEKAARYLHKSLRLANGFGNPKTVLGGYIKLGTFHFEQNELDSARFYALEAVERAKQNAEIYHLEQLYALLSTIHKQQGDYEQALAYHEAYFHAHDSIYTLNAQELLKQEQVKQNIKTYQEEKELATLQAELLTSQNRLYLALASAMLILLLVGSYLFFQLRRIKTILENKNQQLTDINHTKDKFFGIIAHDIRSPIQALESVGKQMDYYLENGKVDKLKRLSSRVDLTAKRLNALLDNLLNWALLQQGVIPNQPKTLSLSRIVEQNIQMFQVSADLKNIQIEHKLDEELKVVADENALNTILRNLLSNAIKFTPKGGSVRIEAESVGEQVLVKVRDTGIGMEPQFMQHIFALNSKRAQGTAGERGTGLGLMLCRELVRLNQGDIQVESKPQQGSDFLVTLPLAA